MPVMRYELFAPSFEVMFSVPVSLPGTLGLNVIGTMQSVVRSVFGVAVQFSVPTVKSALLEVNAASRLPAHHRAQSECRRCPRAKSLVSHPYT